MDKRYTVTHVRERFAEALDAAEQGVPVIIERRGVQYSLTVQRRRAGRRKKAAPNIEILDPAVAEGQWTWDWTPDGLQFRTR